MAMADRTTRPPANRKSPRPLGGCAIFGKLKKPAPSRGMRHFWQTEQARTLSRDAPFLAQLTVEGTQERNYAVKNQVSHDFTPTILGKALVTGY